MAAMLSQTMEYALRAVVHLARCYPEAARTAAVAEGTKVPQAYLTKVLQGLRRAGLVASRRGVGGGVALCRDPRALTLLEVVEAVEPLPRIRACPLGLPSHIQLCPLHRRLDEAMASVQRAYADTTIGEIMADTSPIPPLREVEEV